VNPEDFDIDGLVNRIPGTGDFISINVDKCNGCGRCLIICMKGLWKKKDGKIYLVDDYTTKCMECAACYQVCDPNAIDFHYPAGGTGVVIEQG